MSYLSTEPTKKRTPLHQRPPQTIFQKLATARNWAVYFICRNINLHSVQNLKLSDYTHTQVAIVNAELAILRQSIDEDWKKQKAEIKKDIARLDPHKGL